MPIRGSNHTALVSDETPFFRSLSELDDWATTTPGRLEAVLPYVPRADTEGVTHTVTRGKLLVCHDYKGGYTESITAPSYTFNFWSYCESFIYFSHHRVTVPPSGWTTAAHRHGVKMLGTLIFEHAESEPDCLMLLVGALPMSTTGPAKPHAHTLPVSSHYARLLADLASQRGFDGYLLNFEAVLQGGVEQTRALTMWIAILEQELKRKVGAHAEVVWYDSVIVDGRLRWQDRLNSVNLPFFLPSTAFFTNYTWPSSYPSTTAQYLLSLDQSSFRLKKQLQDIYIGVDVWGRGSHGGGGFGIYKALSHIEPESLGLSVALFGPGWTWESEQDKPGWSWSEWWEYERKLWIGPQNKKEDLTALVPKFKQHTRDVEHGLSCTHGPFRPIADFFPRQPPPNPAHMPFLTTFSPGVGWHWFVRGEKVMHSETGWTDVAKCTSLGDLVFPKPTVRWENDDCEGETPHATADLSMEDAWLGGTSLVLSVTVPGSSTEDTSFRCIWLPIQSLSITPRQSYRLSIVHRFEGPIESNVGACVRSLTDDLVADFELTSVETESNEVLSGEWTEVLLDFRLPVDRPTEVLAGMGLVVGFTCEDPTQQVDFSIHVGSLSVYANPPSPNTTLLEPRVIWADFSSQQSRDVPFAGTLTWGTGISLGTVPKVALTSPEDPQPAWILDYSAPRFAYFNIYIHAHSEQDAQVLPEAAIFVGTTGLDGREDRFYVDPACVPDGMSEAKGARYYIQGVTDKGCVLNWEECAFVDVLL